MLILTSYNLAWESIFCCAPRQHEDSSPPEEVDARGQRNIQTPSLKIKNAIRSTMVVFESFILVAVW